MDITWKNKPESVFGLQVWCRKLDIFKIRNFLRNCLEIFWIYFFGEIFLEDFLGRNSLFTLLKSAKLYIWIWKGLMLLSRFCLNGEGRKVPSMWFWSVSWSTNCPVYFSLFLVDQKMWEIDRTIGRPRDWPIVQSISPFF